MTDSLTGREEDRIDQLLTPLRFVAGHPSQGIGLFEISKRASRSKPMGPIS